MGLVGQLDVQCVAVGLGVDGHGGEAKLATGLNDAHRDLATVGDEQPFDRPGAGGGLEEGCHHHHAGSIGLKG